MSDSEHVRLKRSLTLPLVILYGLGVTIGAGIYVLIGLVAGRAGVHAPAAFLIAVLIMGLTAASFAEMVGRIPVSAGEAAYVRAGFASKWLGLLIGLLVATAGLLSSATIALGSAGYIGEFIDLPRGWLAALVIVGVGLIAAWGIMESVTFAAIFTLIELVGLLVVIGGGIWNEPALLLRLDSVFPTTLDVNVWSGVMAASLLAFYAFIGFEDMVNIAEEVKEPQRTMPWAILLTLAITTLLYFFVTAVAVLTVPIAQLSQSGAPLSLVFEKTTGFSPAIISAIAVIATINGIIIQTIMVSRVLYGLAQQGALPAVFGRVSRITRTPLIATGATVIVGLLLATVFPIDRLAESTSRFTLVVFATVNLALLRLKLTEPDPPEGIFTVPVWLPALAFVGCVAFFVSPFLL